MGSSHVGRVTYLSMTVTVRGTHPLTVVEYVLHELHSYCVVIKKNKLGNTARGTDEKTAEK